ncbi:hypothetical protein EW145_g1677 [Phellinidium pouzarii]|uniref:Uncharacterized protein n=1 Tax=Phellinidium pouzarii TaxID=167371 RepID=A0A4S4LDK6_9AGAM|nr:hypothetical protein EW145_g1677 [Phellinidium pouzarii]
MSGPPNPDDFYKWQRYRSTFYNGRPRFRSRFFPRLLWFGLGAGVFAMFSRFQERKEMYIQNGPEMRSRSFGCASRCGPPRGERADSDRRAPSAFSAAPAVTPTPTPTPAHNPESANEWRVHAESVSELGKFAGDTMTDMSESALDSLMSKIQALKSKLAETRENQHREKYNFYHERMERPERQDKDVGARRLV